MTRRTIHAEHGVLRIDQRLRVGDREIGTDVSGPVCVYSRIDIARGTVAYLSGDARVVVPGRCELFLPPFSIVQASLERCDVTTTAIAFRTKDRFPLEAVLLPAGDGGPVRSPEDALERLRLASSVAPIGRAPKPAPLPARTKAIIDAEYATALEIGRIAARLRTSPDVLSRTFRKAFGMPPVRYRHHVRIVDALMQFADGGAPAEVFQDVGFDDLSRFYKIFRKVACAAPGAYRQGRSRTAKT